MFHQRQKSKDDINWEASGSPDTVLYMMFIASFKYEDLKKKKDLHMLEIEI